MSLLHQNNNDNNRSNTKIIRPQSNITITMGIKCGHAATYSLNGLSLNQIYVIAMQRSRTYYADAEPPPSPTIDIDASWLVRSKTAISPSNKIGHLMRVSICLVKAGFNVVIVCDGDSRHHSKRATTIRIADSYRNRILFLKNQNRILHLYTTARVAGRSNTDDEKEELQQLSKETKTLEKKLANVIYDTGNEFFSSILDKVTCFKSSLVNFVGSGDISVIQAEQQADSCIAARANQYISHMIITADSDQAVLLGTRCVSIKSYRLNNNDGTMDKFDIFCASKSTINTIANYISLPLSSDNYVAAKYVLFDTIDDYKVRALIAVGIGCDVFHSGVKNVGPKTVHDYLIKLKQDGFNMSSYYYHIIKMYCRLHFKRNKNALSDIIAEETQIEQELAFEKMINTFVESYLYEPGNYFCSLEKVPQLNNIYIHDPPSVLHLYNQAFKRSNEFDCCRIIGGADDVDCCVGPGNGEHFFLITEGQHFCLSCSRSICKSCLFNKTESERIFCNECFLSESNINKEHLEDLRTEETMRAVCAEHGCPMNMTDDIAVRINLYQNIVLNKKLLDPDRYSEMIAMPAEPTSYLNGLDTVVEFSLKDGGCFVNNENLPFEHLIETLEIMKELVEVEQGEEQSIELISTAVTPKLVQYFADQSRIHFGWRLLIRGLRHSIDLLTTDVSDTLVKIFKYKNDTGIYLRMRVRSSMKKEWYDTEVAFTINTIVACKCSCKCGSNDLQHVVCIHVLPTLELIGFFLKEALAEHILIEASYYVKKTDLSNVDAGLLTNFRQSLEVFLITANPPNLDDALKSTTFRAMLSCYDVGTDKSKFSLPPPRDPADLGPLKELNFKSIQTIAKNIRTGTVSKVQKKQYNTKKREPLSCEQYVQTVEACLTFCALCPESYNNFFDKMVGYTLLEKRCEYIIDFNTIKMYRSCSNKIKIAIEKANSQFRNIKKRMTNNASEHQQENNNVNLHENEIETSSNDSTYEANSDDDSTLHGYDDDDIINDEDSADKENVPLQNHDHVQQISTNNDDGQNDVSRIKRKSCCVSGCCTTTTNTPQAKWIYVPNSRCKPIQSHSNDKQRIQFANGKYHRELYLTRLGLEKNDKRTTLVHCNDHELIKEDIEFKYKNKDSNWIQLTASMILPKDPTKAYVATRTSIEKYPTVIRPKKRLSHTKYKTKNNDDENQIVNKMYRRNKCDFVGCDNKHTGQVGFKWKRIPPMSMIDPLDDKYNNNQRLYHTVNNEFKKIVRQERCGIHVNDARIDLRICNKHKIEMKEVSVSWQPKNKNNIEKVIVQMYLPTRIARADSEPSSEERVERMFRCNQREIRSRLDDHALRTTLDAYQNASSRSTQNTFGILMEAIEQLSQTITPEQTIIDDYDNTKMNFNYELKDKYKTGIVSKQTKYRINNCSDKFIHQHTGFKSVSCMICFIIVVCKGDIEKMIETTTSLTYYEEWLLYFTIIWGRTCTRWFLVAERFGISETTSRKIFDAKQQMMLDIREDWPKYANFDEDISLQREGKWNEFFDNTRVVMWDMTDIAIHQPSSAEPSRLTFSQYYGGCCGKGGIFLQSSSWIGTHDLWMGAVSDSEYLTRSGILHEQMKFVRDDDLVFKDIPFTNITDKGFRVTADCFRAGGQHILQPPFMKSDKRFTTEQVVEAAAIATIRSANERAVNRIKECEYISVKGLRECENVERVSAVFLTFGFQVNFMFHPVQ